MSKFNLKLDTEKINEENELHQQNFHIKIKNLAAHCVDFLLGKRSKNDCFSVKFDVNFHDFDENRDNLRSFFSKEVKELKVIGRKNRRKRIVF